MSKLVKTGKEIWKNLNDTHNSINAKRRYLILPEGLDALEKMLTNGGTDDWQSIEEVFTRFKKENKI